MKAPPKRKPKPQPVVIQTINPLSIIPTAQ
jgi:hypothetical protein